MNESHAFASDAIAVLHAARAAAQSTRGRSVDAAHVLCGLLEHEGSYPQRSQLLRGRDVPALRRAAFAATASRRGPFPLSRSGLPYARSGKRVVELALEWSRRLSSPAVHSIHLLLALLDDSSPDTSTLLQRHGITKEQVLGSATEGVGAPHDRGFAPGVHSNAQLHEDETEAVSTSAPLERNTLAVLLIFELRDGSVRARRFETLSEAREYLGS
jgi:ATP-dependent Clp protease ATP-binding subunit ClpA